MRRNIVAELGNSRNIYKQLTAFIGYGCKNRFGL